MRSKTADDEADAKHLEENPRDRAADHIAHGDGDGGYRQQRLDDQDRHQKNQQNRRRGQAIDQRSEGVLEFGGNRPYDEALDRDKTVPHPRDGQKHGRKRQKSRPSDLETSHPDSIPANPLNNSLHERVTMPIKPGKHKACCAAIWPLIRC